MGIFRYTAEKGDSFCESVAEHFSGRICAACSAAHIQLVGAEIEEERRHLIAADARVVSVKQLAEVAVARGDVLLVAPEHGLGGFSCEVRVVAHHLQELGLIHIGVDPGKSSKAVDQHAGAAIIHFLVVAGVQQVVLAQDPCLIGPAYGIVVRIGGVEGAALVIGRQGGVVCFGASGDAVEHIDKLTQLCSGLTTEVVRGFRIHIAVAIHIEDACLVEDALDVRKHHRILETAAARLFVEDVSVVIAVDDVAGNLELVVHIQAVGVQQLVGDDDAVVGGNDRFRIGVVAEGFRQERTVRQHGDMNAAREHVRAGQQTGIILHAEEVEERRQDVRRGAVFVHHDIFRKAGNIADEAVAVFLELGVQRLPGKLVVFLLRETVGIVVVREDDAGLVGNAGGLQLLHQVLQRVLKL